MKISFHEQAWEDYLWLQANEQKLVKKLNRLIEECTRTPFEGTGKPEPLRHEFSGFWSRRITDEHRLVYLVEDDTLFIATCRFHYE